jgi:hypothetical protein
LTTLEDEGDASVQTKFRYRTEGTVTYEMVDVGSDYETLSSTAAIVNSNDVACLQIRRSLGSQA